MAKKARTLALMIEGRRDGYSPDQCGSTMTVGELIEYLQDYDESMPVYLKNDNGYTYGSIDYQSFEDEYTEDEDEDEDEDE